MTAIRIVLGLMAAAAAHAALAAGDCDRDMWGHGESWQSIGAPVEEVEYRTCVGGRYAHVDIRNPNGHRLCVTTYAKTSGGRWSDHPLQPGRVLSWSTSNTEERWAITAKRCD